MFTPSFSIASRIRKASNTRRRGNALVEFSLVFLLFFVVILTITELGRGMWVYSTIATATRRAGDYLMVHGSLRNGTLTDVDTIIQTYCNGLDLDNLTVTVEWNPGTDSFADPTAVSRNDIAEVRVSYPFQLLTGLVLAGNQMQFTSTTRVVVAN